MAELLIPCDTGRCGCIAELPVADVVVSPELLLVGDKRFRFRDFISSSSLKLYKLFFLMGLDPETVLNATAGFIAVAFWCCCSIL